MVASCHSPSICSANAVTVAPCGTGAIYTAETCLSSVFWKVCSKLVVAILFLMTTLICDSSGWRKTPLENKSPSALTCFEAAERTSKTPTANVIRKRLRFMVNAPSICYEEPLSPTLSPRAGKGSQTHLQSPSLRAGRDLGWGKSPIRPPAATHRQRNHDHPICCRVGRPAGVKREQFAFERCNPGNGGGRLRFRAQHDQDV